MARAYRLPWFMALLALPALLAAGDPAERRGALVDEVVFTQETDVGKVAGLIEAGSHHVFAQGITNATAVRRLRDSPAATHEEAYGTSTELTLNPAGPELDDGTLNPFAVRAIREAMNWLVNRRHVAEELYGGMAVPRTLPVNTAFPDYARMAETARALELEYGHDPDRAGAVIGREMEALGATREDGIWHWEGEPVRLRVLIRTEDVRERVGDYVANLLEDEGFRVERRYRTAEEASRIWIGSDPATGGWHVYTGSWVSTVINRDVSDNLAFYYTPLGRPDPLWQAYEPDEALLEVAERLQRRDYATREERDAMMTRGMELAMADSARIWLVDQTNAIPRSTDVELATDLAGGIAGSRLWPYTLRFRDRLGGRVVFAAPSLLTEPWNPVAGSNWLFDTMITRALGDSAVLPDPFTGLYWPQRIAAAEVHVAGEAPVERTHDWVSLEVHDRIRVPPGAWLDWDPDAGRFRTARELHDEPPEARSRVRLIYEDDYLERRWHDGSRVSVADIVLPWALTFARADPDSPLFDPGHVPAFEVFQRHFKGWHIVSTDPLVIDVYSDQIYPDAETLVAQRAPTAQPWHTLALGILAERSGQLAFSSDKADRMGVDWLSLVSGPSLAILERALDRAGERGYVPWPELLAPWLDEAAIGERYAALAEWYAERGHFWVGDGPFYLHAVHPTERTVVLRRYEDFPDTADRWLRFTRPRIPELQLDGPMMVPRGEAATFELTVTFEGSPYAAADLDSVRYLLFDGSGALRHQGTAEGDGEGRWRIELDAETVAALEDGANSLEVAVLSRDVALPAFATHAFATVPAGTRLLEDDAP